MSEVLIDEDKNYYMVEEDNNRGLKYIPFELLKQHIRQDNDVEDAVIALYGRAAEQTIIGMTRRDEEELLRRGYEERTGCIAPGVLPPGYWLPDALKSAILLFAGHLEKNREAVSGIASHVLPYSIDVLVKPYRKLSDR